jgi:hypothetical protein
MPPLFSVEEPDFYKVKAPSREGDELLGDAKTTKPTHSREVNRYDAVFADAISYMRIIQKLYIIAT